MFKVGIQQLLFVLRIGRELGVGGRRAAQLHRRELGVGAASNDYLEVVTVSLLTCLVSRITREEWQWPTQACLVGWAECTLVSRITLLMVLTWLLWSVGSLC